MTSTSTAIREIQHNAQDNELRVTFKSGDTYVYPDVDRQTAEDFANAPSKGRYFNQNLARLYTKGVRV